jgi:hypothetical protein
MAFSPTDLATTEVKRIAGEREIFWLPIDPGVTATRGKPYVMSDGVLVAASDSSAGPYFYPDRTVVGSAASNAFTKPADLKVTDNADTELTLVPCTTDLQAGTSIRLANYMNYADESVTSWTASTRTLVVVTGFDTNDYPNGALAYVYEGPGIGEWNIVEDYVHASLSVVFHRNFTATLTTDSKVVFLAPAAADNFLCLFGRCDFDSAIGDLDVSDGADDGDLIIAAGWQDLAEFGAIGQLPFVNANTLV